MRLHCLVAIDTVLYSEVPFMARVLVVLSLALVLIAAAVWNANGPTSAGQPLYGDASCDGRVNSIDAAVVLQYSAGILPSLGCPANADVNGDGRANSLDSALILQYAAGLIAYLGPPVGPTPTNTSVPTPANTPIPTATNMPVSTATPTLAPTATNTPPPSATPVQYPTIYYDPHVPWHNTEIELQAGQKIEVQAQGSVIYDNYHLGGVSPDGDDAFKGWGDCHDHSLVGWVGDVRPARDADPAALTGVLCLGSQFTGTVATSGSLYISINDRGGFSDQNGFGNNVGHWDVTVFVY